ncbi:glycoside hydrolase family 97 protein [Pontibacter sp. 172403-2]|uniref:glycoside hydrolase family 97 protein n=1 Tax=Pontibacter rufus TaxID=2791028 RepID=UPI0018AF8EBD|nr:glycoside hydrolase family 97 protein [Pontibacter sp. 172403-2]MBF9253104.1 glycoside hydrolase family 97 protein [Pontibacter sp. 172403-2]
MSKQLFTSFFLFLLCSLFTLQAQQYQLLSPDNKIKVEVSVTDSIYYQVTADGKQLVRPSAVGLTTDFLKGKNWKVSKAKRQSVDKVLHPVVWQKSKEIEDKYNALHLDFSNGLSLEWRAYDNGIAWRWLINKKGNSKVLAEKATFAFAEGSKAWYPLEDSFFSHNERLYHQLPLDSIGPRQLASLPALFEVQDMKVLLTESDLLDYAGMWLRGSDNGKIKAVFPYYPKTTEIQGDRNKPVTAREDFIAKIDGPASLPWRILMVAREDTDLLTNQLVYQLASPAKGDYSWVKPGKVQWDWWNANNIYNVDFRAGINTETYKYYIDFASKYGLEYVLLDEGWSDTRDLLKVNPNVDMEELAAYARQKDVDLLLWANWLALDNNLEPVLDQFAKWGIKGIKVDFMQRDDQEMVNYYVRVAEAAAKRKMLVDFHGAYKPTGLYRTYPNVITSEGVYGLEQSKGDRNKKIDPEHNVTIPFIRMAAGPMDYTPGAMLNAQKDNWKPIGNKPMSLGTRAHQLAMYVVYESPLQMLADNPTHYYDEPESMAFLEKVPVEWAQTVPLQAQVGDYVLIARQARNGDWYVGGMTDWSPRELKLNLSFLGDGDYLMQVWKDGINADRNAQDLKTETLSVNKNSAVTVSMAKGGGWVARITKAK